MLYKMAANSQKIIGIFTLYLIATRMYEYTKQLINIMNIKISRKKLSYASTHRGCKEMDIILGNFARRHLDALSDNEIIAYSELLKLSDDSLYKIFSSIICAEDKHLQIDKVVNNLQSLSRQNYTTILRKIVDM